MQYATDKAWEHKTCYKKVASLRPTLGTDPPSGEMGTWHMENDGVMIVCPVWDYSDIGVVMFPKEQRWCRNVQI